MPYPFVTCLLVAAAILGAAVPAAGVALAVACAFGDFGIRAWLR